MSQAVIAFFRRTSEACDEFAQVAIAIEVAGKHGQNELSITLYPKLRAEQQLEPGLFGCDMGAHDSGHAAFVGNGQRLVAQLAGAKHQFFRSAGTGEKGEVGKAAQFGVIGQVMQVGQLGRAGHGSS